MKKFLAIALLCAPFASIVCAELVTPKKGKPGVAQIFVKLSSEKIAYVLAPCKEGDRIQYGTISGSGSNMRTSPQSIACGDVGNLTIN